jgi:hypothetical protein
LKKAAALLALGLLQMAGDILRLPTLRGIAAATAASPAPKVFSAVRGLETYSTRFFLEWTDTGGGGHGVEMTPERYRLLLGPYNRRNVYGAVTAYGPILMTDARTRPMFESVSRYALCGRAPLLRELGVDPSTVRGAIRIRLEPLPSTPPEISRLIPLSCTAESAR